MQFLSLLLAGVAAKTVTAAGAAYQNGTVAAPTATTLNGTYQGRYLAEDWDQDLFLGIPFAQPPVGELRFKWPQSINESFSETRDASQYGYSCYQYGTTFNLSEDCLTLNVVRPHGYENETLPVLVWIFGGGLYTGSTADPQYNLSGIVRTSQDIGKPFIAVSMNYRLGMWGFLQSPQILAEGSSNAGLIDQRLALQWVQENIAAFGGDPKQVTIWGESAGAQSISFHLTSYGGRDDGLYRAAILESGGPVGCYLHDLAYYAVPFENLTRTAGCYTSSNQLECLRGLSSEAFFAAHVSQVWNPLVDGDFLPDYPAELVKAGNFIKVPLIDGANSDEGMSFAIHYLDNETAIYDNLFAYRTYALSPPSIKKLLELYPNNPSEEPPYYIKDNTTWPQYGIQWRRDAAITGDLVMIAQRRMMCEEYTKANVPVYSYRFDTPLWNAAIWDGARHFGNVVFSFQNISGALGPLPQYASYTNLSTNIGKAYASFVTDLDPNHGNASLPEWPVYDLAAPKNIVLNSNLSYIEPDTFRAEGIAFINTISRQLLG